MELPNYRKNYVYRYKLSEDCKEDRRQIAGITLTKEWGDFKAPKDALTPFIQTPANIKGIVDYQKKDMISNEVAQQSKWEGDTPEIVPREVLHAMDRNELVPIARYYLIDCVNKDNKMLIKLITEMQEKRIEAEKALGKEKIIENENTNNQILNQNSEAIIEQNNAFFGFGNIVDGIKNKLK